jgi:hypothetical protein
MTPAIELRPLCVTSCCTRPREAGSRRCHGCAQPLSPGTAPSVCNAALSGTTQEK